MEKNIHERELPISPDEAGEILESLATENDRFWHSNMVEPIVLSNGLEVGSHGGHGPVRYHVAEHVPGIKVRFELDPVMGMLSEHILEVIDTSTSERERVIFRHTLLYEVHGVKGLVNPLVIKIHDGALEDMLDHVERECTGKAHRQQSTSPLIRKLAKSVQLRRVTKGEPGIGPLLAGAMKNAGGLDFADSFVTPRLPMDSRDPVDWACAVLGSPGPGWVSFLMKLRDIVTKPFRLRAAPADMAPTGFPLLDRSVDEALLGVEDRHLNFWVGITVCGDVVSFATTVHINSGIGRLYWLVVRFFHPRVVRSVMRSAKYPVRQMNSEAPRG